MIGIKKIKSFPNKACMNKKLNKINRVGNRIDLINMGHENDFKCKNIFDKFFFKRKLMMEKYIK